MTVELFYPGIGLRSTLPDILTLMTLMTTIALILVDHQYILRSGGAIGADSAFEASAGQRPQLFLP
jgi:hypothetical protein